jgi:hypothetical protein
VELSVGTGARAVTFGEEPVLRRPSSLPRRRVQRPMPTGTAMTANRVAELPSRSLKGVSSIAPTWCSPIFHTGRQRWTGDRNG